jgi:GNAT superfamily N-acetyltransferase
MSYGTERPPIEITVRPIRSWELGEMYGLCKGFADSRAFLGLKGGFSEEAFHGFWSSLLSGDNAVLGLAEGTTEVGDKQALGAIAGAVYPDFVHGELVATEACLYVAPNHRSRAVGKQLIDFFEGWAFEAGAQVITLAHYIGSKDDEAVSRHYEQRGYALHEQVYFRRLPKPGEEAPG